MISHSSTNRADFRVSEAPVLVGAGDLTCIAVEGVEEFLALENLWTELTDRATNRSPALSWPWLAAWWDIFGLRCPVTGGPGTPYVVIFYEELTPVAVYPFVTHSLPWWKSGLRRLRPMGHSGELEPSGLTEEAFCAVATGYEERCRSLLIEHLAPLVASGRWDCALVRQMNHEEPPRERHACPGVIVSTKVKSGPQIVRLPETWAALRKQLTKSMRDNLSYYPRLLRRAGHEFSVQVHFDDDRLLEAGRGLIRLHRDRVYSEVGHKHQDYFADAWQAQMLEEGLSRLARDERGFVATLEVDGHAIAAQAFIKSPSELLAHYSGFDPHFAKFSPLLILQSEVFRLAIESHGIRKVNLLFGASPWQTRWGSKPEGHEIRTLLLRKSGPTALRASLYAFLRESLAFARRSGLRRWRDRLTYRAGKTA